MKPYSKEWEAACKAGKIANTLDCERTHKKLSSPTCLELAKKENDELERALGLKTYWEDQYHEEVPRLIRSRRIMLICTALIFFITGIWFTWQEMGQPKIDRNLQESGLRIYQCNGTFYPCAIAE